MPNASPNSTPGELALRELALRFLTSHPDRADAALIVGQVPPDLPFEVTFPEGAEIVGTLVRSQLSVEIIADVEMPIADIVAHYDEAMSVAGWSKLPRHNFRGFVPDQVPYSQTYCRSRRGPSLQVTLSQTERRKVEIRLDLQTDLHSTPCSNYGLVTPEEMLLPPLASPPNSRLSEQGASWGGGSGQTSALLDTTSDIDAISDHYARQLLDAGWRQRSVGEAGPIAWTAWTFLDHGQRPWQAVFLVVADVAESKQKYLHIHLRSVTQVGGEEEAAG